MNFYLGADFVLRHAVPTSKTEVTLLGYGNQTLKFSLSSDGLHINFPLIPYGQLLYAWTFKLTYLQWPV